VQLRTTLEEIIMGYGKDKGKKPPKR
jgi:hypothetical protein